MRLIQVISDFIRRSILTNDDDMVIRSGGVPTRIPLSDVRDHAPNAHKTTHQNGGSDEINVTGLSGQLADNQKSTWTLVSGKPSTYPPSAHKASHENGGSDEINVTGLSGTLADPQTPSAHASTHGDGGSDEINVSGLSGQLADEQKSSWALVSGKPSTYPPSPHATSHKPDGSDEISMVGGEENDVVRVIYPGGGSAYIDGNTTGAIRIKMPEPTPRMYNWLILAYSHITEASFLLYVSGYMSLGDSKWLACSANMICNNPPTDIVRFCRNSDSSEWYIVVGDTTTSWKYTAWQILHVNSVRFGYPTYINSGWEITQITTLPPNIDATIHATAGNASYLEGHPASYFLPADGKAVDSDKLDGHDSSYFMPVTHSAFKYHLNADQDNVTGDDTTFYFNRAIWDPDYDLETDFSNGVFTAPYTGVYLFGGLIRIGPFTESMNNLHMTYVKNTTAVCILDVNPYNLSKPGTTISIPYNFAIPMDAGDTVYLGVSVKQDTKTVGVKSPFTTFYGHLVCKL